MFADMDPEARVYLVLLLVFAIMIVGLIIGLARTAVAGDRARASERAAQHAAIKAAGERDALRAVLADLRRAQHQPELTVTRREQYRAAWDRGVRPNPLDTAGVASPTVAAPLVGRPARHAEAT